jgi:hypothetical protein
LQYLKSCTVVIRSLRGRRRLPTTIEPSQLSAPVSIPHQCWKLQWQVWKDGYFSGSSRHCAPVPRTHKTPLRTERVSGHGRPRLSARRSGLSTGSTMAHCSSFSSQRPAINAFGVAQSISRMTRIHDSAIVNAGPIRAGSVKGEGVVNSMEKAAGFSV